MQRSLTKNNNFPCFRMDRMLMERNNNMQGYRQRKRHRKRERQRKRARKRTTMQLKMTTAGMRVAVMTTKDLKVGKVVRTVNVYI